MPIDFPSSPTTGQVYTYEGKSWVYNGTGWDSPRALSEIGAVQTFENAAARTAAIPFPTEGIVSYLNDVDILSIYDGSAWKTSLGAVGGVVQVVTATTTTNTSTTTTGVNTALSVSITPKSASNRILVTSWAQALFHSGSAASSQLRLRRGSTLLDAFAQVYFGTSGSELEAPASLGILDSPNTTSPIVYGTRIGTANSGNFALVIGRQTIIAMEVAA
jgi:hypothetical protein